MRLVGLAFVLVACSSTTSDQNDSGTTNDAAIIGEGAATTDTETITLPSALGSGVFTVTLRVEDVQAVSVPMQLAMSGAGANGNYTLGTITLP